MGWTKSCPNLHKNGLTNLQKKTDLITDQITNTEKIYTARGLQIPSAGVLVIKLLQVGTMKSNSINLVPSPDPWEQVISLKLCGRIRKTLVLLKHDLQVEKLLLLQTMSLQEILLANTSKMFQHPNSEKYF